MTFLFFLLILVPLLSSCDVIARLAAVPFSFQIIKLFWFMLPLISVFAIPIASALAVGITVGNLFSRDELLLLRYFPDARKKLGLATLVFAVVVLLFFVPIVFKYAPSSYWKGKRFIFRSAQTQIENLPSHQFHTIASRCTFFFKGKDRGEDTRFNDLLLMVRQKDNKDYTVTARYGILHDGILNLFDGTIYNNDVKHQYIATFKKLEVAFEQMFLDAEKGETKSIKFFELQELLENPSNESWQELHKRIGQILWQFLFPFLALGLMMLLGKPKSNWLLSFIISGCLFLFSYISINTTSFLLVKTSSLSLPIFYGIPIGLAVGIWSWYRLSN